MKLVGPKVKRLVYESPEETPNNVCFGNVYEELTNTSFIVGTWADKNYE